MNYLNNEKQKGRKMPQPKNLIDVSFHNVIWQCCKCQTWYNLKNDTPKAVALLAGFNDKSSFSPNHGGGGQNYGVQKTGATICDTCFGSLSLDKEEPKIVTPGTGIL